LQEIFEQMKLSRREFLMVSAVATAAVIVPSGYLLAKNEVSEPELKQVTVPISNLPDSFDGFRLVVLSDFHLYPLTRPEWVHKAVDIANAQKPDLCVLLGDYVWHEVGAVFDLAPILTRLNAARGIFSIIGNHDIWLDVEVVKQGLVESRIPVLVNQGLGITYGHGSINLVGLDDAWSGRPDLKIAMDGLSGSVPTILLEHEPDVADWIAQDPRISLQLSGHTHGGQVRINNQPIVAPHLGKKYNLGLFQVRDMWLYTNAGIGVISVPYRYNCPPEVTEITLTQMSTPKEKSFHGFADPHNLSRRPALR
jgi:uncharacterized protein